MNARPSSLGVVVAVAVALALALIVGASPAPAQSPGTTDVATTEASPPSTTATTTPERTTRPPVTVAPTRPPASTTPETQPATTAAAEAPATGDDGWWPWLLVAVLGVAAIVGVVFLVRRSGTSKQWRPRAGAALDESDQITTHLVAMAPTGLASVAGADAARLAALVVEVQELARTAPDDRSRRALADVEPPLRSLQAALDAVGMASGPLSPLDVDEVRASATRLHRATSLARPTTAGA
jgi:hypothetical protein